MPARALVAALVLVPAAASAASAHAAWPVREIPTDFRTEAHALVPLPDGRVATLLRGWKGGRNRLTLAIGDARTPIGEERTPVGDADFIHPAVADADADGDVTVAYLAHDAPATNRPIRLVVWSGGRAQTLAEDARLGELDLDVAADGTAVVAWSGPRGVELSRRAPGARDFAAPVVAAAGVPGVGGFHHPQVAALEGGGAALAAVGQRVGGVLRLAHGDAPLGPPRTFPVPERTRQVTDHQLVATSTALTYVFSADTRRPGRLPRGARRIVPIAQAVRWTLAADAPTAPVTIPSGPRPGTLRAVVAGDRAFVAFRDVRFAGPRTLGDVRVGTVEDDGAFRQTGRWPGAGYILAFAPDGAGTRVYTRLGRTLVTRRFDAAGRSGRSQGVARVGRWHLSLLTAPVGGGPLALWAEAKPAPISGTALLTAQPER